MVQTKKQGVQTKQLMLQTYFVPYIILACSICLSLLEEKQKKLNKIINGAMSFSLIYGRRRIDKSELVKQVVKMVIIQQKTLIYI